MNKTSVSFYRDLTGILWVLFALGGPLGCRSFADYAPGSPPEAGMTHDGMTHDGPAVDMGTLDGPAVDTGTLDGPAVDMGTHDGPVIDAATPDAAAPTGVCSTDHWCWENPWPQGNTLNAV
ncbi:MAG: hypothetical protein KAI47_26585, partial [Deltaproteobacteria bacterium]|nr:hypothetical protein [Deltaproteobacteria bacterium]